MRKKYASKLVLFATVLAVGGLFAIFSVQRPLPADILREDELTKAPATDTHESSKQSLPPKANTARNPQTSTRPDVVARSETQTDFRQATLEEKVYYPLLTANDPAYANSWALQHMNAPEAWDITTGNNETVVAVLDSGFALDHDDLKDQWYENTGETGMTEMGDVCWTGLSQDRSTNDCDDDTNGYVDDWRGWNFVLGDENPLSGRENPDGATAGHGTEVSGLVGAAGNNATGTTTLNWSTRVMPLQVLSDDGPGYTSDIIAAIHYAVDNGADVINMSLGTNDYDDPLRDATDYAYEQGVVVVAAAGNCGTGNEDGCSSYPDGHIGYPARNPHVIAVGATTSSDQRASFSSYGDALDVVAPGSGLIYSPTWTPENGTSLYASALYGTSYASPYVASLASLIKSIRPDTTVDDITRLILASAQKINMGSNFYTTQFGHGIIDAHQAVLVADSLNAVSAEPILSMTGSHRSEHSYYPNSTAASGCSTETIHSYCTLWIKQASQDYDRYLPYALSDASGYTNWTWPTNLMNNSDWSLRAAQGEFTSAAYGLSRK